MMFERRRKAGAINFLFVCPRVVSSGSDTLGAIIVVADDDSYRGERHRLAVPMWREIVRCGFSARSATH